MPQSLAHILVHLVFGTKEPFLTPAIRPSLEAYLAEVARNARCGCYRVGGVFDHVHLALTLSRTICVATFVETVKTSSSKWIKPPSPSLGGFAWQRGYGVFSVAPSDRDALCSYIDNQRRASSYAVVSGRLSGFPDEYGVTYDERCLGLSRWIGLSALKTTRRILGRWPAVGPGWA